MSAELPARRDAAIDRGALAIPFVALAALLPLLLSLPQFGSLFWFGDEWDQLDQIDVHGFGTWLWMPFAENVVPVFKLIWGGAMRLLGGSYAGIVWLLWLVHALNTLFLGRVLVAAGFPPAGTFFSQALFALSATNVETLAWGVQLSPVLSVMFMLVAFDGLVRAGSDAAASPLRVYGAALLLSAASAFSFSRGVLTGPTLAAWCLLAMLAAPRREWPTRLAGASALVLPSIFAAALIMLYAGGNHRDLTGGEDRLTSAAVYGLAYLALNPFYQLFGLDQAIGSVVFWLGGLKIATVAAGLALALREQRRVLLALVAFDLANAVLMGIGRYHMGLETAASARYQYVSLLVTLPFLAVVLSRAFAALPWRRSSRGILVALTVAVAVHMLHAWRTAIAPWAFGRGVEPRRILMHEPAPPAHGAVPGLPSMSTERAKALITRFQLH